MARFEIEHLTAKQLIEAWPVVRMSHAHAKAIWWQSEGAELLGRGGGILAARAPDGNIHGVATYEVTRKALLGRVLSVDTLITFELSRRAPAQHALYEALELLAAAFDCRSIVLPVPSKGHARHRTKAHYGIVDFEEPRDFG
jgi:hypothetical protein